MSLRIWPTFRAVLRACPALVLLALPCAGCCGWDPCYDACPKCPDLPPVCDPCSPPPACGPCGKAKPCIQVPGYGRGCWTP
jgi:hypothetical protein